MQHWTDDEPPKALAKATTFRNKVKSLSLIKKCWVSISLQPGVPNLMIAKMPSLISIWFKRGQLSIQLSTPNKSSLVSKISKDPLNKIDYYSRVGGSNFWSVHFLN